MMAQNTSNEGDKLLLLKDALDSMVSASASFKEKGKEADVIYGLLNQGYVNESLGKIDEDSKEAAENQYKEAYGKAKKLYGKEHYYTCDICNRIASLYISDGNVKDAELWLKKALRISINEQNVEVTDSAIETLNNIAYNCWKLGEFGDEIGALLVTAEERYTGTDDAGEETIRLYNNLSSYYHNVARDYKMARHYDGLYRDATLIGKGRYNYETAICYHNLANDYRDSNYNDKEEFFCNYKESLRLYKESLQILEKIDPKTITDFHVNYDGLKMDIEEMEWCLRDIDRAISWYEYNEDTFGYQKLSLWITAEDGVVRLLSDDEYHVIVSGQAKLGQ